MNTGNDNGKSTILIVNGDDTFSTLIQKNLKANGYKTARTSSNTETIDWLSNNKADMMLLDHGPAGTTSKKLIEKLKTQNLQTPFVVVSGQGDERVVADMIKSGAIDYVVKNADLLNVLPMAIKRAIEKCKHEADLNQANKKTQQKALIDAHLTNISKNQDLQKTTDTLNSILDSSTEYAIAATDLDFKISHYNPTAEKLFGYRKEDVIGKTIQEMHTKEKVEPEKFDKAIETVKKDGKWEYDVTGKDASGGDMHLHSTIMPMTNPAGEMIGYVLFAKDVTKQKNMAKKIEALAKFPDENPNPVLRVLNDGTVLYGNNASEPLLKKWDCRQGQKLPGKWLRFINDALRSGLPQQIKIDCRQQIFSLTFAPVVNADYVNIYALDITEKKSYEDEVQKSYKLMEHKVKERTLQLQKTVKDLQTEVVERIKDEAIILEDQKQLRKMASELMIIEERERRDIATALHDSIGQILAFSSIELGNIISKTDKKHAKSLKKVRHNIEKAITETRKLTYDLSPAVLYSFGLNPAIEHLSEQFSMDHGPPCSFETDDKPIDISTEVELFLYRAVRELLVNIAKHAKAKKATIKTKLVDDNFEISVSDDGQGFDLFSVNVMKGKFNSIGLLSIKERLTHIGGSLKIYSMPGKGTVIRMLTPVGKQD